MSDLTSPEKELDRLAATPNVYRARAQAAASLAATGAAAISAGAVFGDISRLPLPASVFAVVALIGLLVGVAAYVAASQHRRKDLVPSGMTAEALRTLVEEIYLRMRVGAWAGFVSVVAFLIMVGLSVFYANVSVPVEVVVRDGLERHVQSVCNGSSDSRIEGWIRRGDLTADRSDFLPIRPKPSDCGANAMVLLPRSEVILVLEVDD